MQQSLLRFFCLSLLCCGLLSRQAGAQVLPDITVSPPNPVVTAPTVGSNQVVVQPTVPNASVFMVAHQDDWQLFMGSRAFDNVQSYRRVVFIIVTAGQSDNTSPAWWQAREMGCANSTRIAANARTGATPPRPSFTTVNVRGHQLTATFYRNTAMYFLRLPDGGLDGRGYTQCQNQTLRKLMEKRISTITSVDGANTYTSWNDLTATVKAIINTEIRPEYTLWVNSPNPDVRHNPGDHPDHIMAGALADTVSRNKDCRRLLFNGYNNARRPANLNATQTAHQRMMFEGYSQIMTEAGQPNGWDSWHLAWIGRQYSVLRHVTATRSITLANAAQRLPDSLVQSTHRVVLAAPLPNPCTASSLLSYDLPEAQDVRLVLYDMQGRIVRVLVQAHQAAGHYEVWLDASRFPASGLYVCQLQAGKVRQEQRVMVVQ